MICFFCGKEVSIEGKVGRSDVCRHCSSDLKVCRNCTFHDERVYNECKEHNAERVVDKTRANFCEFFTPKEAAGSDGKTPEQKRAEAMKAAAEALFKKN